MYTPPFRNNSSIVCEAEVLERDMKLIFLRSNEYKSWIVFLHVSMSEIMEFVLRGIFSLISWIVK